MALRVYNMQTVSTISTPHLLGADSVYRLHTVQFLWYTGKREGWMGEPCKMCTFFGPTWGATRPEEPPGGGGQSLYIPFIFIYLYI